MRNFKSFLSLFTLILLFFSQISELTGQRADDFIIYKKRAEIGFTGSQVPMLNRMVSNPLYKGHYYVQLRDLTTISTDGTVTVNLPTTSTRFLNTTTNPPSNDIDGDGINNITDVDAYDPCNPSSSNANCT